MLVRRGDLVMGGLGGGGLKGVEDRGLDSWVGVYISGLIILMLVSYRGQGVT